MHDTGRAVSPLVIIGAGGHGKVVDSIARTIGRQVLGFLDDDPTHSPMGPVSAWRDFPGHPIHVAIGNDRFRLRLAREILEAGGTLETLVHPQAAIDATVEIGAGSVIIAGSVANVGARIGVAAIVNTNASVDHHVQVGDGAQICPNATLLGGCRIGEAASIGSGAVIERLASVGAGAVVYALSFVNADVPEGARVCGCPARLVQAPPGHIAASAAIALTSRDFAVPIAILQAAAARILKLRHGHNLRVVSIYNEVLALGGLVRLCSASATHRR